MVQTVWCVSPAGLDVEKKRGEGTPPLTRWLRWVMVRETFEITVFKEESLVQVNNTFNVTTLYGALLSEENKDLLQRFFWWYLVFSLVGELVLGKSKATF